MVGNLNLLSICSHVNEMVYSLDKSYSLMISGCAYRFPAPLILLFITFCYYRNLKVAKSLGMETIRECFLPSLTFLDTTCVTDVPIGRTLEAVNALEAKLGLDLTSPQAGVLSKL